MKANLAGVEVHYEVSGRGPWVMLSHSLAANLQMWAPQLPALEQHFTVLRYDTRGHGQTQASPAPYTLDQLADDAHALLQHVGAERAHWVGLSLGGMIGQTLAIRHPGCLDRIVIADSTGKAAPNAAQMWGDRATTARQHGMSALVQPTLSRWFTEAFAQTHPALMAQVGDMIAHTSVEGYAGCCAAIAHIDTLAGLQQLKHPGLVLVGEQDLATPVAMSEQIHQHWPGSTLVRIDDAAHLANLQQPDAFTHAVLDFLRA
jgi:3-oxoadipate enol-lactonase